MAAGVTACGGDDSEGGGDDFASQASAICVEGAAGVRDVNLELGFATSEEDLIERLEGILEVRQTALSELEGLEPPADSTDALEDLVAAREDLVVATEAEIAAREDGDAAATEKAAADATKASEATEAAGADLGVDACEGVLPEDDAQAAEDALREFATTADPETSCSADGLVTEIYLKEGFGGVDACTTEQEKLQENPDQLAEDIEVSAVTGVDDVTATVEYEDVGGKFDAVPSRAQFYYVDGGWKLFQIAEAE